MDLLGIIPTCIPAVTQVNSPWIAGGIIQIGWGAVPVSNDTLGLGVGLAAAVRHNAQGMGSVMNGLVTEVPLLVEVLQARGMQQQLLAYGVGRGGGLKIAYPNFFWYTKIGTEPYLELNKH